MTATLAEYTSFIAGEIDKWAKVIRYDGISRSRARPKRIEATRTAAHLMPAVPSKAGKSGDRRRSRWVIRVGMPFGRALPACRQQRTSSGQTGW